MYVQTCLAQLQKIYKHQHYLLQSTTVNSYDQNFLQCYEAIGVLLMYPVRTYISIGHSL